MRSSEDGEIGSRSGLEEDKEKEENELVIHNIVEE